MRRTVSGLTHETILSLQRCNKTVNGHVCKIQFAVISRVQGGSFPRGSGDVVVGWKNVSDKEITSLEFAPCLGEQEQAFHLLLLTVWTNWIKLCVRCNSLRELISGESLSYSLSLYTDIRSVLWHTVYWWNMLFIFS